MEHSFRKYINCIFFVFALVILNFHLNCYLWIIWWNQRKGTCIIIALFLKCYHLSSIVLLCVYPTYGIKERSMCFFKINAFAIKRMRTILEILRVITLLHRQYNKITKASTYFNNTSESENFQITFHFSTSGLDNKLVLAAKENCNYHINCLVI